MPSKEKNTQALCYFKCFPAIVPPKVQMEESKNAPAMTGALVTRSALGMETVPLDPSSRVPAPMLQYI